MKLIIYTKTGCPWCADALSGLRQWGVPFEEREVRANPDFFKELEKKSGQTKTPTLDLNGEILADTDRQTIQKWLKDKNLV